MLDLLEADINLMAQDLNILVQEVAAQNQNESQSHSAR
jgi:hypothetical protein